MFTILSLVTSVKDYIEVVHKLVETSNPNLSELPNYYDLGSILTYLTLTGKEILVGLLTFKWLQNIGSIPFIVPDVASAMISEISVLDGYLHNAFTFLETPISYGNQNSIFYGLEKFSIGFVNSLFLCLPTSTAHIITLRRFVMQGLEAGYLAGLGTLCGNILWIGSILFGLRFIVIPWLSLDILRYMVGFLLLVKYMWDSYNERRTVLEDLSKWKIFLLNFLLAFTEQATIYPFLSNISIGSDTTILETFPAGSFFEYSFIHVCYLAGLVIGSLSLLQLTCWFWENPAYNIYMWAISSLKMTNTLSQKFVNMFFLYLTMFFAISNVSYFGLDYTITNPLGLVHEDRLVDQKVLLETSFLNTKASDRNTRRNRGRHGRRERWKRRVRRYRTFDASLYDQGIYDLFTIEDLNYGFDRFWLRRKIRNHRVRFRFFPGPWMRSFKKQLARPRLESFMGPRVEFFRILFEQAYHPEFHEFRGQKKTSNNFAINQSDTNTNLQKSLFNLKHTKNNKLISFYSEKNNKIKTQDLLKEHSALRKFIRKFQTRTNTAEILLELQATSPSTGSSLKFHKISSKPVYSKRWKQIFSKISHDINQNPKGSEKTFLNNLYQQILVSQKNPKSSVTNYFNGQPSSQNVNFNLTKSIKQNSEKKLSKKDNQILRYKSFLTNQNNSNQLSLENGQNQKSKGLLKDLKSEIYKPFTLVHPIKYYLQKEKAFQKKMKFYGANIFRNFGIENNAPYYRIMMKKFFYYYKPNLRWERTMRTATMRKARRKGPRVPRKLNITKKTHVLALNADFKETNFGQIENLQNENTAFIDSAQTKIQKPTHFYSLVSKRATRYRYQIYKDVLQHWYYTPFNRMLLKFDVDAFIRRQPSLHFLSKKEENLLHLKRYLLSEYYNSLRWYSYMQHYDVMKSTIGTTKSFANRAYNQQFFGTFKKIRHLFAITPSLTENNVLKFDQPLFNEYKNNEPGFNKNSSLYNSSIVHEELLADEDLYFNETNVNNFPQDLTNQSTKILKTYLQEATPIREEYIRKLIAEKNYSELTSFLFKGQKVRGTKPIPNEKEYLNQEKLYISSFDERNLEKEKIQNFVRQKIFNTSFSDANLLTNKSSQNGINFNSLNSPTLSNETYLWISLLKKCRNKLYNQEALKLYVTRRVDKLEKQKKRQEKSFKKRLEQMKNWSYITTFDPLKTNKIENNLSGLTTSIQNAIKEGIQYQIEGEYFGTKLEKSNLRNNRQKILENLSAKMTQKSDTTEFSKISNISLNVKNHLKNQTKLKVLNAFEAEQLLRQKFYSIQKATNNFKFEKNVKNFNPILLNKVINRTLIPFKFVSNSISEKVNDLKNSGKGKILFNPIRNFMKIFPKNKNKNLNNWKQREIVLLTRKKIRRKIYRVLDQKRQFEATSNLKELESLRKNQTPLRKKDDNLNTIETKRRQKSWNLFEKTYSKNSRELEKEIDSKSANTFTSSKKFLSQIFEKNFKRKRSRSRRYRRFKGRGPIKKHTLAEKLKRQFKLLKRYGEKVDSQDKKMEILQMITKRKYDPESSFKLRETKQRRTRQGKHRFWKKHKRQKYLQTKRKQRKQRRYAISKLRVLNKEFKRMQGNLEMKKWWWQSFLPNFMATNDTFWEIEKDRKIQQELADLSISEILQRDGLNSNNSFQNLQIGNQDFKPLAIPEALRIQQNLVKQGQLNFENGNVIPQNIQENQNSKSLKSTQNLETNQNIISKLSENLLKTSNSTPIDKINSNFENQNFVNLNPMPFYAGWDETLRQFIVTNRLLSRSEAGYSMNFSDNNSFVPATLTSLVKNNTGVIEFTKAPLQGMNAATTLYWQIPFTTYDPDQFFALGMDGFSPLAWRFFNFKHSKQTTKPMLVKNVLYKSKANINNKSLFSYNIHLKLLNLSLKNNFQSFNQFNNSSNTVSKNQARKIQKRQKRIKKHPRPPVWFPSGPLTNQVLPVHYIYVFYKRARLPRDRYIGRRLRRLDDSKANFIQSNFNKIIDFTLRKRVKPIRKYHRKRIINQNQNNGLTLIRRPFKGFENDNVRFRPITKTRLKTQTDILNANLLKSKQRKKNIGNKQTSENLRIRQLRRRIQRQVLRPIWRYKPRSGGFVWPGDYLRLESVKAPTLKVQDISVNKTIGTNSNLTIRKKKRRNIQEWQIQPKKYLLQKHNLKVLKKRLQISQNSNKLSQKVKELNTTLLQF